MTDKEKLIDMLDRAGIKYESGQSLTAGEEFISVERGYIGFSTWFHFHRDGSLKDMGAFEG